MLAAATSRLFRLRLAITIGPRPVWVVQIVVAQLVGFELRTSRWVRRATQNLGALWDGYWLGW